MLKKKAALILSGMLLLASLGGCGSQTDDTELADNQRYAYAVVTAIEGNEITYMEVDESQVISTEEDEDAEKPEQTDSDSNSDETESGDKPSGEAPTGEPPSGDAPSDGEAPSGEAPSGEKPSDGEAPSGEAPTGEAPTGDAPSDMPSNGESVDMDTTEMPSDSGEKDTSNMTGGVVTTQIPVGVTVHTAAGTETTFSRIATGDVLKLLLETDDDGNEVILEIWMIEQ